MSPMQEAPAHHACSLLNLQFPAMQCPIQPGPITITFVPVSYDLALQFSVVDFTIGGAMVRRARSGLYNMIVESLGGGGVKGLSAAWT
jgi:hypothetical protein